MFSTDREAPAPQAVACTVTASATAAVPAARLGSLREPVLAAFPDRLGNSLLKQADEQSLLALEAFRALFAKQPELRATSDWGLVAAPRMLGRRRMIESYGKFREHGAWSVSPHIIPQCTLHALSGLLSQALGLHGPNIGAGGKIGNESEALTVAATWLETERLPGVWVVLTGWDRESIANEGATCQAAVLAVSRAAAHSGSSHPRLTIQPGQTPSQRLSPFTLESLLSTLENGVERSWQLGSAGSVRWQPARQHLEAAA